MESPTASTRSTRRLRRLVGALLVGALVAAACGGDDDTGEEAADGCPVDALDGAEEPVEITLWHTQVGLTNDTLNGLADEYNASQDRVRIEVENQGAAVEELARKYRQSIPSGDLPAIAMFDDRSTQFLADSGTLVPAGLCAEADGYTDYEDDFLPVIVDFYTVDGVLQPGSFFVNGQLLYYNRDHFTAAGLDPDDPPSTLAEVRETAQAIRDAGVVDQPFVLHLAPFLLEHWVAGVGEGLVDNENGRGDGETATGALDNDAAASVLDLLLEMDADGTLNAIPGIEGQFDHFFAMGLEQASMMVESSLAVTTVNAVLEGNLDPEDLGLDTELPPIDVNLDAGEFPGLEAPGRGAVGGHAFYLTNAGTPEEQAAAWDFVKFANEPENQLRWTFEGSYLPIRQTTAEDPEMVAYFENTRPGRWLATAAGKLDELDPDWPGPLIGPYTETRDSIRDLLDEVVLGGAAVSGALEGADSSITEHLTTYNEETF